MNQAPKSSNRSRTWSLVAAALVFAVPSWGEARKPAVAAPVAAPMPPMPIDVVVRRIVGEALVAGDAERGLEYLCDRIGNRLAGTPQLDQAIAWAQSRMRAAGLAGVHAEPVMVPVWKR